MSAFDPNRTLALVGNSPDFRSRGGVRLVWQLERAAMPAKAIVGAEGRAPVFSIGDDVRVGSRFPIGHFRVPNYIRGKRAVIEAVIHPRAVNNEEEGYGRNAGARRHYYRVAIPMTELWPSYEGPSFDSLRIEVFETWLERDADRV